MLFKLQKDFDAQSTEIKDLCVAYGSKDAEIAALQQLLSNLPKDTDVQLKEVSEGMRD